MGRLRANDRVSHAQYGTGTVIEAGGRYIVIGFDDGAVRKFVTALVQLERTDLPPVRAVRAPRHRREAARLAAAKRNGR